MNDDLQLLREYAASRSEAAFETVVARYVGLVHSAALRQVRDPFLAEEITQAVFIILARKAGSLSRRTILPGWLYRTTRYTAANALRREASRQFHEHAAVRQSILDNDPAQAAWQEIWHFIDEAVAGLGRTDRDALVLRYFENLSIKEVGAALGIEERAAQKRISRGLERLRVWFAKRGVTLTTWAVAGAISANSVQAAPAGLRSAVMTASHEPATAATLLWLVKSTWQQLVWRVWWPALSGGLGLLALTGMVVAAHRPRHEGMRMAERTYVIQPQPRTAPVAVRQNPAQIRLELEGTPGLPFELTQSANGFSRTIQGVLPWQLTFDDADYNITIEIQGPGQFGLGLYRDEQPMTWSNLGPVTHPVRYTIAGKKDGQGISLRSSNI